jgi:membrane-bound serine protease (ClpP class)
VRRLLLLLGLGVALFPGTSWGARAQGRTAQIDVVEVQGVIDPSLSTYVREQISSAERDGSVLVLQIDSRGSYGERGVELGQAIRSATVPVIAWIGPTGARAEGGALFLVYSSSLVAMAPGAGLGPARPFDVGTDASHEDPSIVRALGGELVGLAAGAGANPDGVRGLLSGAALPAGPALSSGAVQVVVPNVDELLRALNGRSVRAGDRSASLETLDGQGRVAVAVRFHDLGPVRRVLHAVSTPTAVYVLLVVGLWAIAFELTQPGLGVAGISGVLALALAGYGLSIIPVDWFGLALLVSGIGLQGLDVLIRRLAWLTAAGTAAFAAGSVLAWRGVAPAIDLSPWLIGMAALAGALFFGFALTVALRARERIRTAQVGLVGLVGETRKDLDPEGAVFVKGTLWRARSSDGPIPKGRRVRVRGVDGLILQVEEEGPD